MKIRIDDKDIEMNEEWSFKDFTNLDLTNKEIPPGTCIYRSCFFQQTLDAEIFKKDMTGVTFYYCNLDNVKLPDGNAVVYGTHNRIMVAADGREWLIDHKNKPKKLVNEKHWKNLGYSISPRSISKRRGPPKKMGFFERLFLKWR